MIKTKPTFDDNDDDNDNKNNEREKCIEQHTYINAPRIGLNGAQTVSATSKPTKQRTSKQAKQNSRSTARPLKRQANRTALINVKGDQQAIILAARKQ